MDVLIRGMSKSTHAELTRRAAKEGMSLNAYLRGILEQHTAAPSMQQWLDNLDALGSIPEGALSGADVVAAAREEDDALVER